MNAIPFDTLKMARKLEASGFPGPQAAGAAEAMAEAMSGAELATKADLLATKSDLQREIGLVRNEVGLVRTGLMHEIGLVRTDLMHEVGLVRTDLMHEIGLVRTDLDREMGRVRSDMTSMETRLTAATVGVRNELELLRRDLTIRLGTMIIGGTGIMLAAMRFMLTHP
jgi:hypothetical protein